MCVSSVILPCTLCGRDASWVTFLGVYVSGCLLLTICCCDCCGSCAAARTAAARKVKAARETAKRAASDQKEKVLHERMQRVRAPGCADFS